MDKANSDWDRIVRSAWVAFFDSKIVEINMIPIGFKNKSFFVNDGNSNHVMKIYANNFLKDETIEEYSKIVDSLKHNKIPVITPVRNKDGNFLQKVTHKGITYQITVSKFVESTNFSEHYLNQKLVKEISNVLRNLHESLLDIQKPDSSRVLDPISTMKELLDKKTELKIREYFKENIFRKDRLEKYLHKYKEDGSSILNYFLRRQSIFSNTQLIHGDFNLTNLNIQNGKIITIFDFDEMTLAPVHFEIGCSIVHLDEGFMLTDDLIENFITDYYANLQLKRQDIEDIVMFMKYRCFYRISRWFTYYRFSSGPVEHFSKYQEKLEKYNRLNIDELIKFILENK